MEQLSWDECECSVKKAFEGRECKLLGYDVRPASDTQIGFLGVHLRIEARVLLDGSREEAVRLFAKKPPTSEAHGSFVAVCSFFRREAKAYTSYAPRLKQVLLPAGPRLPMTECYFARGEDVRGDVIVMQDLRLAGYEMADKRTPMDLLRTKAVLWALARLHGASVLMQRNSELYRKGEFESIEEAVFMDDPNHPSYKWSLSSAETFASAVVRIWPERFPDRAKVFEASWNAWKEIFKVVRHSDVYLNVLCHGDTWANNIMFRENGDGLEAILVDFQQHRYAPPALDIVNLLHTTTRREFRDENLEGLLAFYREAFSRVVSPELADQILTMDQLRKCTDEVRVYGRCFSTSLLPLVLLSDSKDGSAAPQEEKPDFIEDMVRDRADDVLRSIAQDDDAKERIMECYQEFLESAGLWE
ncbi:uncharacterized protein LOC124166660 [Ischnura elegans]|uniref:uncharacterized protein LOC124166660 n=1 Tax=Ischnura elegans TaxID=197161 RepID=UPI001ED88D9C|nr:uncharacterized protein LOC124166660 [Ischnura elegans]